MVVASLRVGIAAGQQCVRRDTTIMRIRAFAGRSATDWGPTGSKVAAGTL